MGSGRQESFQRGQGHARGCRYEQPFRSKHGGARLQGSGDILGFDRQYQDMTLTYHFGQVQADGDVILFFDILQAGRPYVVSQDLGGSSNATYEQALDERLAHVAGTDKPYGLLHLLSPSLVIMKNIGIIILFLAEEKGIFLNTLQTDSKMTV
jgi:hypothetical protein